MINQTIAGYRLVRTVGESTRACVILGQPAVSTDEPSEPVILTLYRSAVSTESVQAECDAMTRVSSEHLTTVWDIASSDDGSAVIVSEWIPGISLSKLLRMRAFVTAGEAVTILAPLVETLAKLHRNGVLHGNFGQDSVVFRASGSPVIVGLSRAVRSEVERAPAVLASDAGVHADIEALVRVVSGVMSAVRTEGANNSRLSEFEQWLSTTKLATDPGWAFELEKNIFGLGAPEPVRLLEHAEPAAERDPLNSHILSSSGRGGGGLPDRARTKTSSMGLPLWIHNELESILTMVRSQLECTREALRRWLAPVRLRVWLLGALAAMGIIAAVIAAASSPSEPDIVPAHTLSPTTSEPIPSRTDVAPSVALHELLAARERCFRDLSIECLRHVESSDSPALRLIHCRSKV
ncbi:MAG: hypothetical protein ACOH14_06810 [Rhodoglobus sp.]